MTAMFKKLHGASLAKNSWVENFHVERLASDPTELDYAGRVWFNTTERVYKWTELNDVDAVVVRTAATVEALTAALAQLDADLRAHVASEVAGIQTQVNAMGNAFNYVGKLPNQTGVTGTGTELDPYVLDAMEPGFTDAGDYYKVETAGYFKLGSDPAIQVEVNDGVVFNTSGGLDRINNQQSSVDGTADEVDVTGSTETGFTVSLSQAIKDAISTNATAISNETARAKAVEGLLSSLTTTAKGNLVAAINEVMAGLTQEIQDRAAHANAAIQQAVEVGNNLSQEIDDRTEADNAINLALTQETVARTNEDAELDSKIAELAAWAGVTGDLGTGTTASLDNLSTEAKASLVAAINELKDGVDNLGLTTAIQGGKGGNNLAIFTSAAEMDAWVANHNNGSEPIVANIGDYVITEFNGDVTLAEGETITVQTGDRWYITAAMGPVDDGFNDRGDVTIAELEGLISSEQVAVGDKFTVTETGSVNHGPDMFYSVTAGDQVVVTSVGVGSASLSDPVDAAPTYTDRGQITAAELETAIGNASIFVGDFFTLMDPGSINYGPDMFLTVAQGDIVVINDIYGPGDADISIAPVAPATGPSIVTIDGSVLKLTTRGRLNAILTQMGDLTQLGTEDKTNLVAAINEALSSSVGFEWATWVPVEAEEIVRADYALRLDEGTDIGATLIDGAVMNMFYPAVTLQSGDLLMAATTDSGWGLWEVQPSGTAIRKRYFGDDAAVLAWVGINIMLFQTRKGVSAEELPWDMGNYNYLEDGNGKTLQTTISEIYSAISGVSASAGIQASVSADYYASAEVNPAALVEGSSLGGRVMAAGATVASLNPASADFGNIYTVQAGGADAVVTATVNVPTVVSITKSLLPIAGAAGRFYVSTAAGLSIRLSTDDTRHMVHGEQSLSAVINDLQNASPTLSNKTVAGLFKATGLAPVATSVVEGSAVNTGPAHTFAAGDKVAVIDTDNTVAVYTVQAGGAAPTLTEAVTGTGDVVITVNGVGYDSRFIVRLKDALATSDFIKVSDDKPTADLQAAINDSVAVYNSVTGTGAATTHTFTHGLTGEDLSVEVQFRADVPQTFNDLGSMTVAAANNLINTGAIAAGDMFTVTDAGTLALSELAVVANDVVYITAYSFDADVASGTATLTQPTRIIWVNDSAPTHIDPDNGTVTVYCSTAEDVKIIVKDLSPLGA